MKVIVFGGTGSVGRLVVEQALERGHEVTVFTRNAESVTREQARLTVVEGNVFEIGEVASAIEGHNAVIVTLGNGSKGDVRSKGTASIVAAMHQVGVRRLIVQSTLGVGDSWDNLDFMWKRVMFGFLLRRAYSDHVEQERVTRASGLEWTIARPAAFVDGPRTGQYRLGFGPDDAKTSLKIARADVADFVVSQLTDDAWLGQTPALAYA
ncbi:putative NADH-flavin reductase [Glaciihabitans tibetensis]|uniref:Putative NADH-flavin reductase n=1 Tax=Glaciihabitans tibetensis TaxID=1266600 RepID=A0A2T0VH00_9MICO|nr:SDR family oxidoreductase [Glaciihabitans tibetensis]PRY69353.1 putative NADH-flavin reductase [Glaciihabitans tibetensis]